MPPELSDYYHAEKRQHALVTWALGFATLTVTIALAFTLFLGARWIVNKVRHEPAKQPVATKPDQTATAQTQGSPTDTTVQGGTSAQTSATTPTQTTPQTSSATTNLPNTGPGSTMAVFLVATAVGTFVYRRTSRR